MGADKRYFERFFVAGTVMIQSKAAAAGSVKTIKGELLDLSFKGGGFCSREQLKKGENVIFLFLNKGVGLRLRGEAKIVSVQKIQHKGKEVFRYGMEFGKLDSEALRDIVLNFQKDTKRTLA